MSTRIRASNASAIVALIGLLLMPAVMVRAARAASAKGTVNLPFVQSDGSGNQWMVYNGGAIRQQGPQPVFAQADVLNINGAGFNMGGGFAGGGGRDTAQIDSRTGELIVDNLNYGSCTVTRRILINKDDGSLRIIDVIKNTQSQQQTLEVSFQTIVNFGINNSATVADPEHAENQIGWVGQTGIGRAAVEMFAGKGAKIIPSISAQPGNNVIQATIPLTLTPGKTVALLHFLSNATSFEQGQQYILNLKEASVLQSIPSEIRREIVNFPGITNIFGDYEILRGDAFDIIELHTGDQIKGTLTEKSYKLATFYGPIEIPSDQVNGLINVGQFRPRQLIVTADGQIFGGQLQGDAIGMELSSGQSIEIPVSQIARVGYHKRPDEPAEWTLDKPFVLLRTGDRVEVEAPAAPIDVVTRYGLLRLDPATIAAIAFQSDDNSVHEVFLIDGSHFAGLVSAPEFDLKLAGAAGAAGEIVKFPSSGIIRLQLTSKTEEPDEGTPAISLLNQDLLVGSLAGDLKLDTAFDTLQISAPEIRKIAHTSPGSADVQVTLWDESVVSGQFEEPNLHCKLASGAGIDVPVFLLGEYNQPYPQPSSAMIDRIKAAVADLSADDWKQRDAAEARLVGIGPAVVSVLRDLKTDQTPEAQQRIDSVIKQLGGKIEPSTRPAGN